MDLAIAPVTYAMIVANIIASSWAFFFDRNFTGQFAFNVGAIARHKQHYRVFTSSFLHNDPIHLTFNMVALFSFGPLVEAVLGRTGFFVVYFGAILSSGILSFFVNRRNDQYTSVGASDAVSGVIFAGILISPFDELFIFPIPFAIPAWGFGFLFLGISTLLMGAENRRIAHEGHLGGALAGIALTALMLPRLVTGWF